MLKNSTVVGVGFNAYGTLGDGTFGFSSVATFVQCLGISTAVAVSCSYHNLILLQNGTVRAVGRNEFGQLGNGTTVSKSTTVQVTGISTAIAVCATGRFSLFLLSNGTVKGCGENTYGQLGDGSGGVTTTTTLVTMSNITSAIAIAGGFAHSVILLADGTIKCCGQGSWGQCGDGTFTVSKVTPVSVLGITSAIAISAGYGFSAALLRDGTVWTWGLNDQANLGINSNVNKSTPVQVWGISSGAVAISCGINHLSVLFTDGSVKACGRNDFGCLGDGTTVRKSTVVPVLGASPAVAISSCGYNQYIVLSNGSLVACGSDVTSQVGDNSTVNKTSLVSITSISTVSLFGALQFQNIILGPVTTPAFQLELSTDLARKLTSTTWTTGSDERIKKNIESADLARCIEIIQNLDLKYFKWDFPAHKPHDAHSLGWIAQEVEQFFPKSVEETPAHGLPDFKNLNSDQIIKVMWGALKKLRADLKARRQLKQ
jgi:alpha-tubulin suppressor-like RCC1 family protein